MTDTAAERVAAWRRLRGVAAKAADIDDAGILVVVEGLCYDHDGWTNTTAVAMYYPEMPFKVVAAKLSKLLKRKLVTGCDCGCRGDWEVTAKGRELAGIAGRWRENPMEPQTEAATAADLKEVEGRRTTAEEET